MQQNPATQIQSRPKPQQNFLVMFLPVVSLGYDFVYMLVLCYMNTYGMCQVPMSNICEMV